MWSALDATVNTSGTMTHMPPFQLTPVAAALLLARLTRA